jgi:predicted small lipoprotein YifL
MKTHMASFRALAAALALAGCEQKSLPPAEPSPTVTPAPAATPAPSPSAALPPSPTPAPPAPTSSIGPQTASSPANADGNDRPSFSSQSANEYVQSYDEYIEEFKRAYQAMKRGDMTKYQGVIQRAHELESKGERLSGELTPEERMRFAAYLDRKANELAEFTSQNK